MFVVIVLVLLGILLVRNVRIVPQAYCYVIERLGVYHTTWNGVCIIRPGMQVCI